MIIKMLADGGNMSPGPALSQKLGPAGINMGQVIAKINESTKDFKGMKVPVELDVNPSTKQFEVRVFSPPVSGLLKKELGIQKGSGLQIKEKVANASIEQIILIAKTKMPNLLCKDLKSAVKTVAGTCTSLGILIENKMPLEVIKEIDAGKYNKEISQEKTQTDPEKKKELADYFDQIKTKQEQIKKQEASAAEEASKAAADVPAVTTATAKTASPTDKSAPTPKIPSAKKSAGKK